MSLSVPRFPVTGLWVSNPNCWRDLSLSPEPLSPRGFGDRVVRLEASLSVDILFSSTLRFALSAVRFATAIRQRFRSTASCVRRCPRTRWRRSRICTRTRLRTASRTRLRNSIPAARLATAEARSRVKAEATGTGGGCDLEILGPDRAALQSDPDAPHPLSGAGCDERRRVSVRLRRGPPWDLRSGWRGAHAVPPIRSCPQRSTRRGHSRAASC